MPCGRRSAGSRAAQARAACGGCLTGARSASQTPNSSGGFCGSPTVPARTPSQQARDRLRDQAHAAAGLTPLRFTHEQVRYEPRAVEAALSRVARRLARRRG